MTFEQIASEVIDMRFRESQRASVKRWVNQRSQAIWAYADWPWKRQGPVDLTVASGDANPTLPSGFQRPVRVYDDLGNELLWMEPDEFDTNYRYTLVNSITGRPEAFRWVDDVITLGPTPNSDYTFSLVYDRVHTYLAGGSTPTIGLMSGDNDQPIWDESYHYILVVGAMATGLRLQNDPTFPPIEEEYTGLLLSMQDHYLPTASPSGHMQYGNDWDLY